MIHKTKLSKKVKDAVTWYCCYCCLGATPHCFGSAQGLCLAILGNHMGCQDWLWQGKYPLCYIISLAPKIQ